MATTIPLPVGQQRIVLSLLCQGIPMSVRELVKALYSSRHDGGPDRADRVVIVTVRRLRQKLRPYGIDVLSIGEGRNTGIHGYMVDPDHVPLVKELFARASQVALQRARELAHAAA